MAVIEHLLFQITGYLINFVVYVKSLAMYEDTHYIITMIFYELATV